MGAADSRLVRRRFHIYTGNHLAPDAVEEYCELTRQVLTARGLSLTVGGELRPDCINIIVDEFSDPERSEKMRRFRADNPETPIVLLLTEFVTRRLGMSSFNNFGGLGHVAGIAVANLLKRRRRPGPGLRIRDVLVLGAYLPVLVAHMAQELWRWQLAGDPPPADRLRLRYRGAAYLHSRYLGFISHLDLANAFIGSHEMVLASLSRLRLASGLPPRLGVLYPEIDPKQVLGKVLHDKVLALEVTGSVTPHRRLWMRNIDEMIVREGLAPEFLPCFSRSFKEQEEEPGIQDLPRAAFSLHPPQSSDWPYCSPTRIYRALVIDHSIPVLTRRFGQNPAEDLCLLFEGEKTLRQIKALFESPLALGDFLRERISQYNAVVKERNDQLLDEMLKLAGPHPQQFE